MRCEVESKRTSLQIGARSVETGRQRVMSRLTRTCRASAQGLSLRKHSPNGPTRSRSLKESLAEKKVGGAPEVVGAG